jgi:hypothetical protein
MIKVYDDLIPEALVDVLEKMLLCNTFPWYISTAGLSSVNYIESGYNNTVDSPQLVHPIIINGTPESAMYSICASMLSNFFGTVIPYNYSKNIILSRMKANCQIKQYCDESKHNPPHLDYSDRQHDMKVCLYYVSDFDGDTYFFENYKIVDKVSPKRGRMVVFDGNIVHASSPPRNSSVRVVINTNLFMPCRVEDLV